MKTVKRQRYSNDFKDRALALVGLGRSVPEVAQELGIGTSILYRWTLDQRQGMQAAELRRLRKENAQLLLENDILKKAAVILGTQPLSKPAR